MAAAANAHLSLKSGFNESIKLHPWFAFSLLKEIIGNVVSLDFQVQTEKQGGKHLLHQINIVINLDLFVYGGMYSMNMSLRWKLTTPQEWEQVGKNSGVFFSN